MAKSVTIAQREVVGSGISEEVSSQIAARESLVSQTVRTKGMLEFFNSNGAWVRLTSSIDTLTAEQVKNTVAESGVVTIPTGDSQLAKINILQGGGTGKTLKSGISAAKFAPIVVGTNNIVTAGEESNSLYNNYESRGLKPQPGITSVEIKSKNTFGTLREATIGIAVHSLEDLEIIQALYLRPGYSMLLEWGHSLELDSETSTVSQSQDESIEFTGKKRLQNHIEQDLLDKPKKSSYNSDGMYGYVKNFSWNFNASGGYDCTVNLISKGSLLESLSATADPMGRIAPCNFTEPDEDEEEVPEQRKSAFHKFFYELNKIDEDEDGTILAKHFVDSGNDNCSNIFKTLENFTAYRIADFEKDDAGLFKWYKTDLDENFISIGTLFNLFNRFASIKSGGQNLIELYTGTAEQDTRIQKLFGDTSTKEVGEYYMKAKYITNDFHFSIDPGVCVLPKETTALNLKVEGDDDATEVFRRGLGPVTNLNANMSRDLANGKIKGTSDDILNIFVSVMMLKLALRKAVDGKENKAFSVNDFFNGVLDQVASALGGINELDLYYDESINMYFAIDRKQTPTAAATKIPKINLTGLRSTISSLSISSKISSNMGSQIAISAQGAGKSSAKGIASMMEWNTGLLDRHTAIKDVTEEDIKKKEEDDSIASTERITEDDKALGVWTEKYADVWESLNGDGDYDVEMINELRPYHKTLTNDWVLTEVSTDQKKVPGTIPVELSFTTLGIAGLKVGQSFRIAPGVLPAQYDTCGYIITGISHKIAVGKWTTDVKTQFYNIAEPINLPKSRRNLNPPSPLPPNSYSTDYIGSKVVIDQAGMHNANRLREAIRTAGYVEKGEELSNGGDITSETATMAISVIKKVKELIPGLILRFTGGNDAFHHKLKYVSRHTKGRGIDFVLRPATPANIKKVETILKGFAAGSANPNFRFINEYARPTAAASAKHFHISWGPGTEGDPVRKASLKLAAAGKLTTYNIT